MGFVAKVNTGEVTNPIGATLFGVCNTAAGEVSKKARVPDLVTIENMDGLTIHVYFANSNTAEDTREETITLEIVNGSGQTIVSPRFLRLAGNRTVGTTPETSWYAQSVLSLTFYGQTWYITGWLNTNTTYTTATESQAGLMPASAVMQLSLLQDVNIHTLANISVPANWTDDTSVNNGPKYPDYPKTTTVTIAGVSASMVPTVVFDPAVSAEYGIAPVAETGANSLTLYAETAPAAAITILTLVLQSGHGTM